MNKKNIEEIIHVLCQKTRNFDPPLITTVIREFGHDPYLILIACLLSLRVKDMVTVHVCRELFMRARTPQEMLSLSPGELEKILFKTGFYRNKARVVRHVSEAVLERFHGNVPDTREELLSIKGIGRKTANLVLGVAFEKPAICVDTHVHRISNRLGIIKTTTVEETERELERVIPQELWVKWNKLLVMWGQNICVPISPLCGSCALYRHCKRVGVKKHR